MNSNSENQLAKLSDPGISQENSKARTDYVYAILNTVPAPILVLNPDLTVKTSNEAFNRLFQVDAKQTENQFFYELAGGNWDVPDLRRQLAEVLATKSNVKALELSADFPSIGRRTMVLNAQKLEQSNNEPPLILLSIEDVTEKRQIEASNRWMGAIVESSDDAIISKDLNGVIRSCNRGAATLFGYEVEELIGKPMKMLIPRDHQNEEDEILARIRSGRRIEHFETVRQRKDGSLIEVSLMISPVKDATGRIIGASKIARDITERKRAELSLAESYEREKAAREQAEAANRAKDDFLASLSHELRTPLNPILLIASDSSENPDLPADVRSRFETIRKNIELEARLIDDLLDLTRITHGKLSLHLRIADLGALLEETIGNIRSELNEKQIRVQFRFESPRRKVHGDDVRLQQVFWNVLKNAVKFTPPGGTITIELRDVDAGLQVSVADTGIGMSPGELARIFSAFSQGDHARSSTGRYGGLGLGLAITRKLVEMHHGQITAHSAGPGLGSAFVILLPAAKPENYPLQTGYGNGHEIIPTFAPKNLCVLLVEDHEATRHTLAQLLGRRGYKALGAASAQEAKSICAREKIDVVISDIGLPDGSGNELIRYLRKEYGLKGIALTGYGMDEDVEQCLSAGFSAHLTKPVNVRALEKALQTITNPRAGCELESALPGC